MELNQNGSLAAIEQLFEEFYSPYTSNSRKHEIEGQLNSFKNTPHLCEMCLYFISNTSSQYVTMFALQILESVINQQWANTISWSMQEEIKVVLQNNLVCKAHNIPQFLRNKYAKLLIDIAKYDWPHRYPNFFDNILALLKSEELNQLIGLTILRMTCEEFMGINAQFQNRNRKKEVTRLFQSYIPIVFELLTSILEKLATKPLHTATATPPPSPTHPSSAPAVNNTQELATATFRTSDYRALNQEALNTVQYMFAWVPIEEIPPRLIRAIFSFTNISTYAQEDDDICVCAMSTINEIFYRKCSPPGSENFFREIYNHTVELIRNVTSNCTYRIDSFDDIFVQKLCELLVLIIEQHLWRFEKETSFSAFDFLSLFFQYTMQLQSVHCYLRCLTVWTAFFKQIKEEHAHKYAEVFLGLGDALVKKIQFKYNSVNSLQLLEVNSTELDEENKTEWQYFLESSTDIISRSAQQAPMQIFNQVLNSWNMSHTVYRQLGNVVDHHTHVLNLEISETENLYYILRDYATLTSVLSGLAHHFYNNSENNDVTSTASPLIYMLIDNLLQSASQSKLLRFDTVKVTDPRLTMCFIEIHSELLTSLKTWLKWMEAKNQICDNVEVFLDTVVPILLDGPKVPAKISNSAAHLFLEIARKPNNNLAKYQVVVNFIQNAAILRYTDKSTSDAVNSGVCDILLRPLKNMDREDFGKKQNLINMFFSALSREFRELTPNSVEHKIQETVSHILPLLSHIIEYCRGFPILAKKELTNSIKQTLDHALLLFPTYVKYTEVHNHFSKFFITILKNLQSQIGIDFTRKAIQIFLQVAVSEQQANNLSGLQQLLDIFCVIVRDSGNSTFLPDILQLCMENIYPLLLPQASEHPDVFVTFLDLIYSILNFRWLYFYNSQVMLGYSPGGSDTELGPDVPKRPEQLLAILRVFGEALLQDDINIFRRSVIVLQDLNRSKRLFHKGLFRSHLLSELLRVLLNTLLYKRQGLSCEDILFGVYSMAEVDFDGFFSTFLPHFIQNLDGLTTQQREVLIANFNPQNDRDVPSFLQHLQNFASDFQHFRMCNIRHNSI